MRKIRIRNVKKFAPGLRRGRTLIRTYFCLSLWSKSPSDSALTQLLRRHFLKEETGPRMQWHRREWSLETAYLSSNQALFFMGSWTVRRVFCPSLQSGITQRSCQEAPHWATRVLPQGSLRTHAVSFPFCATQCDRGTWLGQHSYMGFWGVWCNPVGSQTRTCNALVRRPSFPCRALQPRTRQSNQDTTPRKDLAAKQASFPWRVSPLCPF